MEIKNFFSKLRELWKIPKFKGIIQLLFWILFFTIVAIIFRNVENQKIEDNTIKNEKEIVNSYEYNYQFSDSNNTLNIRGTNFKNQEVFYIGNNKFYYVNNNYYNALDNSLVTLNYALQEWSYNSLKNIMEKNTYTSKLEYEDNTVYEYNINYLIYNNYYNTNYNNNIVITITLKDDFINSATINYGFAKVNINYTNINKLKNLDINID